MSDLQTLIRTVDPDDRVTCDELNARFFHFLYCDNEKVLQRGFNNWKAMGSKGTQRTWTQYCQVTAPNYTSSLDALKAVQDAELEGWVIMIVQFGRTDGTIFECNLDNGTKLIKGKSLLTMQLAWLDALVQAIQWKRGNTNDK